MNASSARSILGLGSLAVLNSVGTSEITNGTILDADISNSAAINGNKISGNIPGSAANVTGTVAIANGGTGATNQSAALTALLPAQSGNTNKVLGTNGTVASWQTISSGSNAVYDIRTTDATVSTSSPTYRDGLSVALEAGKTYLLDATLMVTRTGTVSTQITYRLVYSGTAITDIGMEITGSLIQGTTVTSSGAFDIESAGFSGSAGPAAGPRAFKGYLRTTTPGIIKIQAARMTTNTANNFVINKGSFLIARPLN